MKRAISILPALLCGCSTLFGVDERGNVSPGLFDVVAETARGIPGYGWAVGGAAGAVALIARHYLIVRAGRKDDDWDGKPDDVARKKRVAP